MDSSAPENCANSAAFLRKINKCLHLCIIQFQVAFLDAALDCVEGQWFFNCGYIHHGIMGVSQTIPPGAWWMVTRIQQWFPPLAFMHRDLQWLPESLHNIMNSIMYYELMVKFFAILHWETLCLNWLTILSHSLTQSDEPKPILACKDSLWWMLLLYSILITSPVTSEIANCETFQNSVTCNLFNFGLPLSQLFWSVLQASHSVVFYICKIQLCLSVKTLKMFSLYFNQLKKFQCINKL